jgi:integrase
MRVAVRYAVNREELERDPFRKIEKAAEDLKEKGVLSSEEMAKLIQSPIQDPRARLGILLGMLCAMRRGEIRGLQWGDISTGLIHICHNWQDGEGIKEPKRGSRRIVPVPAILLRVLNLVGKDAKNFSADAFVFDGITGKPLGNTFFRNALIRELKNIDISSDEQKRRNITFHSLRHTCVTLLRLSGITDLAIQALAGHKDANMMHHYSHALQVLNIDAARESLEKALDNIL